MGRVSFIENTDMAGAPADFPVYIAGANWWRWTGRRNPFTVPGSRALTNVFKPKAGRISNWTIYEPRGEPPSVIYPVHCNCMRIVYRFLGEDDSVLDQIFGNAEPQQTQACSQVVEFYSKMCAASMQSYRSHQSVSKRLLWRDHDCYGAAQFCGPKKWIEHEGWEFLLFDPINIPGLRSFLIDQLSIRETSARKPSLEVPQNPPTRLKVCETTHRSLNAIPAEVLDIVASYLSPRSVVSLSRVSRYTYVSTLLNQKFWRAFFARGGFPWLWEASTYRLSYFETVARVVSPGSEPNWRILCKRLIESIYDDAKEQQVLNTPLQFNGSGSWRPQGLPPKEKSHLFEAMARAPLGLWNRRRIWAICQNLWDDESLKNTDQGNVGVSGLTDEKQGREIYFWMQGDKPQMEFSESVGEFWNSIPGF